MFQFERVSPESLGIPSAVIVELLETLEQNGVELHGLTIGRYGKVCAQTFWRPYGPDIRHLSYSAAKTVTAIAVGFAEQEGTLSLQERLLDFFPECSVPEEFQRVRLEHLITMSCGHEKEPVMIHPEWKQKFFDQPLWHPPGEHFLYNSPGVNMLVAALCRRTGKSLVDFLRPRLFEPLEMSPDLFWNTLPDGTEMGSGALFWRMEDFSRFTLFLLQKGVWNSKRLLNENWFSRMTTKQIDTPESPMDSGYGYWTWVGKIPGSYLAAGMCGQYGLCFPEQQLFVTTNANGSTLRDAPNYSSRIVQEVNRILIPQCRSEALPENGVDQRELEKALGRKTLSSYRTSYSPWERNIQGVAYYPRSEWTVARLGGYQFSDGTEAEKLKIQSIQFAFSDPGGRMQLNCGDRQLVWELPRSGDYFRTSVGEDTVAVSAQWQALDILEVEIRFLERILAVRYRFHFQEEGKYMESVCCPVPADAPATQEQWQAL